MNYLELFKMPTAMKITGRTSTITNAFVNAIIPVIHPTEKEVEQALAILGLNTDPLQCSYCGATCSEWDHLRPLVVDKMPTGYISEIHNLVPSCGKCNQSKGNKNWKIWMHGDARLSPKTKQIPDLTCRTERLQAFEEWSTPTMVDFEAIVGTDRWNLHWQNCNEIMESMREAQTHAKLINQMVTPHRTAE